MKKKLILAILAATLSTGAMAAGKFTGTSVGLDIETTKYKDKVGGLSSKNSGSVVLKSDVGFDYGNNFVGVVELRSKLNSATILKENEDFSGNVKQKDRYSIGYAQGYRVTSDLMPYVKAEYQNSKLAFLDTESGKGFSKRYSGFGVGVGAKYAITDSIEMGAEYVRSRLKKGDDKLSGNAFNVGIAYRFK
ncbi:porin family protein [Wielerella bovis]|uniref:porin family protein n=1 Tax=Wielerella bovis TaxID=2917790 RepID=UPI00201A04E7|nr:porin family protein [Wielerella bovis]MCG7656047.1 porin family protein [Wielerella bovis]MCG7658273.1 porin family protein [Wielerella bovis]ULJ69400.1 porin family protein [Wielerella bovis]